jgi:hypothetical protein
LANGSLTRLFWRLLDVLDYWLTQAQLWLADAVCDPKPEPTSTTTPQPAPSARDCDRVLNPHSHGQAPRDLSEKVTSVGLRLTSLHRRHGAAWLLPQRTVAIPLHADIGFSCGAATSVVARLEFLRARRDLFHFAT